MTWSAHLARPLLTRDGRKLAALADARDFVLSLPDGMERRPVWQGTIRLLMEVAEDGDEDAIGAATHQLELALFTCYQIDLSITRQRQR